MSTVPHGAGAEPAAAATSASAGHSARSATDTVRDDVQPTLAPEAPAAPSPASDGELSAASPMRALPRPDAPAPDVGMRAHRQPVTAAPRPQHYARLGTERGKLPAVLPGLTLGDLPAQRGPGPAAATPAPDPVALPVGPAQAAAPSSSSAHGGAPTARADRSTDASWRPSAYQVEFEVSAGELLVGVLDGTISVTRDHRGVRLRPSPPASMDAVRAAVVVRRPAARPLRIERVLALTGWTVDELLADILSGALPVHRALGGPRLEADDCGLPDDTAVAAAAAAPAPAARAASPAAA